MWICIEEGVEFGQSLTTGAAIDGEAVFSLKSADRVASLGSVNAVGITGFSGGDGEGEAQVDESLLQDGDGGAGFGLVHGWRIFGCALEALVGGKTF